MAFQNNAPCEKLAHANLNKIYDFVDFITLRYQSVFYLYPSKKRTCDSHKKHFWNKGYHWGQAG